MLFKHRNVTLLHQFRNNVQGAISIDFVILTAGIVVLSIAVMALFTVDLDAVDIATAEDGDGNFIPGSELLSGGNAISQSLTIVKYKMTQLKASLFP